MVQTAGGSWWQRFRGRHVDPVAICTFCDRPPAAVAKLVAGPAVYVCDACIARAERVISAGRASGDLHLETNPRARCSFCDVRRTKVAAMVAGPARLCADCLRLCREIVDGRAT
jgi:ATP-dependent protease Clp ATPase subunit